MAPNRARPLSQLALIREAMAEILKIPEEDQMVSDYIVSIIISTVWSPDADPLWGWLIGPAGMTKTESLRPLKDYPHTFYLSTLTENALISGYDPKGDGSQDPSLIPKLKNKVLVIKDGTALLNLPPLSFAHILGDLRDAFDGFCSKAFGTVGVREFASKFGLIVAITDAIDDVVASQVILGERFLSFRVGAGLARNASRRKDFLRHCSERMATKAFWREELKNIFTCALDKIIDDLPSEVERPFVAQEQIINIADLVANFRLLPSTVKDPRYSVGHSPEIGSRLVNQFNNAALARAAADGRDFVDDSDMAFVTRVARSTLPPISWRLVRALYGSHNADWKLWLPESEIVKRTALPVKVINPILYQYTRIGLIEQQAAEGAYRHPGWRLQDETLETIRASGICGRSSLGPVERSPHI